MLAYIRDRRVAFQIFSEGNGNRGGLYEKQRNGDGRVLLNYAWGGCS